MRADDTDRQFASTLASGVDLLLCFRAGEPVLGNRDFAERTGLSRPTVVRLTHTLTELGYLRRDGRAGYRLGAAVIAVSHPLLASTRIRPIARPMMEAFSSEIGGAVSLGMRHRTEMVYVETARGSNEFVTAPDIGSPLPMLATAMGRAWLAHASSTDRLAILNQIELGDRAAFERDVALIEQVRRDLDSDGFVGLRAEWQPNGHGLAVPIAGLVDGVQYILNCGVLASRKTFSQVRREVAPQLVALSRSIQVSLGLD